jgi:hypothetical protein
MAQQQDTQKLFGDDINSTALTNLQQLPVMTSKADTGNVPLELPVYNPNMPIEEKRVRFSNPPEQKPKPHRRRLPQPRRPQSQPQFLPPQPQFLPPQPQFLPPQPQKTESRILNFLGSYRQHLVVFVMVFAVLWYYSTLAATSYFGNGTGYVSLMGGIFLASASSTIYGVTQHVFGG